MGYRLLFKSALLFFFTIPTHADSILYFVDDTITTDRMTVALNGRSSDTVVFASSDTDFASQIATGNYDLGILFIQVKDPVLYDGAIQALANFVNAGGKAIFTDWSANNDYAQLFDFSYAPGINQTSMTVGANLHTDSPSPLQLINDSHWTVFATGLSGPNVEATFDDNGPAAILRTKNGSVFVNGFLSDTVNPFPDGIQLYNNEIDALLNPQTTPAPTPLPGTCAGGLALLVIIRICRLQRKPVAF